MLRPLHPEDDRGLIKLAYGWARDTPKWFREMDATCGQDDFEAYLKASKNGGQDIGIFDPELCGVIILSEAEEGYFECHLMAPRTASFDILALGGFTLRRRLFSQGAQEISAWVASKNRPLVKLVRAMGLAWKGIEMAKGKYHDRVIHWHRYAQTREEWKAV